MKKMRVIEGEEATQYTKQLLTDIKHELMEIAQEAFTLGDFEGASTNYYLSILFIPEYAGNTINFSNNKVSEEAIKIIFEDLNSWIKDFEVQRFEDLNLYHLDKYLRILKGTDPKIML